jgi:uncharacterized membrane protein
MKEPSADDQWQGSATSHSPSLPVDALAVVVFVVLANGVLFTAVAQTTAIRALVGLPLLFFVPGYAVVSMLFPSDGRTTGNRQAGQHVGRGVGLATSRHRGIGWRERFALSFGTSVALQPLFAIALSLLGLAYTLGVLAATLSGFAVLFMIVAVARRNQLPPDRRFHLPYDRWIGAVHRGVSAESSGVDVALNVALALVVLTSLAGVGYAVAVPNNAESFTSATLLTETDQGELVANGYPETLDESEQFVLRLANHEGESRSYTVVAELQRVESADGSQRVAQRDEVVRTSTTVADGATWTHPHMVQPTVAGDDVRLIYYVYRGEAPSEPSVQSADRYVHVWLTVPSSAVE